MRGMTFDRSAMNLNGEGLSAEDFLAACASNARIFREEGNIEAAEELQGDVCRTHREIFCRINFAEQWLRNNGVNFTVRFVDRLKSVNNNRKTRSNNRAPI